MNVDQSIIKPLRPSGPGWDGPHPVSSHVTLGYPGELWFHRAHSLSVISAVEVAKDTDGIDRGPEYHISIAKQTPLGPERCSAAEASWMLDQFGLDGAEEDNHVPNGKARNFWRAVAEPLIGLECACKDSEAVVIEGDYEHRPLAAQEK